MRLPPLLLNLLMLLAIVLNTIPAHAHASMAAHEAGPATLAGMGETPDTQGAMPCHDEAAPGTDTHLQAPADPDVAAAPPCCDGTAGACECACLLQVAALASALPRLPPSPPRAAPAGVEAAEAAAPSLASLIRPPIG
ncbi:MAG: CopL family metal-binding regulatory protein [Pseudomonas sp.]|nr:CopL family metal-binding regulatory protein [Pseudomonas sp.]